MRQPALDGYQSVMSPAVMILVFRPAMIRAPSRQRPAFVLPFNRGSAPLFFPDQEIGALSPYFPI